MSTTDIAAPKLVAGDVITGIDAQVFPFPFTIRESRPLPTGAAVLIATHGWFGVVQPHHVAHKVA